MLAQASAAAAVRADELFARLDDELRATVHEVIRLTPTHRRGRGARADGRARLPARPVLSAAELRDAGAPRAMARGSRWKGWRSPAPRSIATAACCRPSCSRWAARPISARSSSRASRSILMGPTGTPTEIPHGRDRAADRRRPRQRGAVLDRPGDARAAATAWSTSPATRRMRRPLQGRGDRARRRRDRLVLRRGAGLPPDRPQDKAFVGNIVAALDAYGTGALGAADDPARRRRPRHRDRLGRHDGGGRAGAARHPRAHLKPGHKAIGSINSPMQCMMKEICAQCLQVHRDPGDRRRDAWCSPASTRTRTSIASISPCLRGAARPERRAGEADAAVDRPLAA